MLRSQILKPLTLPLLAGLLAVSATASAYDRHVTIVNDTSYSIVEFYGSNTGTQSWEEDILGVDVLGPGEEVEIDFNDATGYCKFDFMAVFDDGTETVEEGFNVCDYGTLTITE